MDSTREVREAVLDTGSADRREVADLPFLNDVLARDPVSEDSRRIQLLLAICLQGLSGQLKPHSNPAFSGMTETGYGAGFASPDYGYWRSVPIPGRAWGVAIPPLYSLPVRPFPDLPPVSSPPSVMTRDHVRAALFELFGLTDLRHVDFFAEAAPVFSPSLSPAGSALYLSRVEPFEPRHLSLLRRLRQKPPDDEGFAGPVQSRVRWGFFPSYGYGQADLLSGQETLPLVRVPEMSASRPLGEILDRILEDEILSASL